MSHGIFPAGYQEFYWSCIGSDIVFSPVGCRSHYLNQRSLIVNWKLWNTVQWNLKKKPIQIFSFKQMKFKISAKWQQFQTRFNVLRVSSRIIVGMGSVNERQCYNVTWSLIGWAHTLNDHWSLYNSFLLLVPCWKATAIVYRVQTFAVGSLTGR